MTLPGHKLVRSKAEFEKPVIPTPELREASVHPLGVLNQRPTYAGPLPGLRAGAGV